MRNVKDQDKTKYTYVRWNGLDHIVKIGKTTDPIATMLRYGGIKHSDLHPWTKYQSVDVIKLIEGDVVKDLTQNLSRVNTTSKTEFIINNDFIDKLDSYQCVSCNEAVECKFWESCYYNLDRFNYQLSYVLGSVQPIIRRWLAVNDKENPWMKDRYQ